MYIYIYTYILRTSGYIHLEGTPPYLSQSIAPGSFCQSHFHARSTPRNERGLWCAEDSSGARV